MQSAERAEFDGLMDQLCAGLDVPSYDVRKEAYWKGLKDMTLIQFGRVVEFCCSEKGPDKFPKIPQVWKLWRAVAASSRYRPPPPTPPPQTKGLQLVNGMFLKYLHRRRLVEDFKGDLNIEGRRHECLSLAQFFDEALADQLLPDREERQTMFDTRMGRVKDAPEPREQAEIF
jgi:hypothetical protein